MLCCDDCSIGWAELLLPSDQLVCFDVRVSRLSLIRVRRVSNSTNKQLNTVRHRFGIVPTVKPTTILTNQAQCPYSALAPRQFKSQTAATLPSDSGDTFGVARHAPLANVTRSSRHDTARCACACSLQDRGIASTRTQPFTYSLNHYVYVQHFPCLHRWRQHQQHCC